MKIVRLSDHINEREEQTKQFKYLKDHYEELIEEFEEMGGNEQIQILRSELVPVKYLYILDWYYTDELQRSLLMGEWDDEPEDIREKKTLLDQYEKDLPRLEPAEVKNVREEIELMLDAIRNIL